MHLIDRALAMRRLKAEARGPLETFAQKVTYKMAFDRSPLLHTFVDKVASRDWIADRVGEEYLPKAIAIADRPEEVDWDALPESYAAKVSHASGGAILVSPDFDADARLPTESFDVGWERYGIRREHAHVPSIHGLMNYWLSRPFDWWPGRRPEWAYRGIPRRILIEDWITEPGMALPSDIKVFVFNGHVQYFRLNFLDAQGGKSTAHYDREGKDLDVTLIDGTYEWPRPIPAPPVTFDIPKMIELSEALGAGLDFARVDLYHSDRGFIVGEITIYSNAGAFSYIPEEFGRWAGKDWHPKY